MFYIFRLIPLIFFVFSSLVHATPRVVEIKGVTSSSMSIIIDIGSIGGIKPGDKGYFFSSDSIGSYDLMEVAKGEVVKSFPDYSFWSLSFIRDFTQLKKGNQLGLLSESEIQKGRKKYNIRRREVVLKKGQTAKNHKNDESRDFPLALERGENDFVAGHTGVTETNLQTDYDFERTEYFDWVDGELTEVEGFEEMVRFKVKRKYPDLKNEEDIERKMKEEIFNSYVRSATNKSHDDQIAIENINKGEKRGFSVFDQYIEQTKRRREMSAEALEKVKRDGPLWSTGMDDNDLRRYIIDSGLQAEVNRRSRVLEEKMDHEVQFRYSQGVISNASAEGEKEYMTPKHFILGYEAYLKRVSNLFDRITIGIFYENGLGYYENNGINLKSSEHSARGEIGYYFFRSPTTLRKLLPFVTLGTKYGFGVIENSNLDNSYLFQIRSLPTASLGIKYRFHAGDEFNDYVHMGVGALFVVSYERLEFTTAEVMTDEDINESFVKHSVTAQAGISIYF